MAQTHILILFTWTLLQAFAVCNTADTCALPIDNAVNIRSLQAAVEDLTSQLRDLKRDVGPKVAFSASLADKSTVRVGPAASQTIVFKNVFFNNGDAYSSTTGYFTAPQKGAYLFSFNTHGLPSYKSGARLVKNGQFQVSTWERKGDEGTMSGSVILSLNVKETVNLVTWGSNYQVYDDGNHYTYFSGVLLFPL